MRDVRQSQNVTVNIGRRRHYFPLLAFMGFVIAFFWPLSLPGMWKLAEVPWLLLLAVVWGIAHGLSRAGSQPSAPRAPAWQPQPGPRDYTLL